MSGWFVFSIAAMVALPAAAAAADTASAPVAVLIDSVTKQPVVSARLVLGRKTEGKFECVIDTSLTGVSNERGEIRIPRLKPGEYVVFYNLSTSLHREMNGKAMNYDPTDRGGPSGSGGLHTAMTDAISDSLGERFEILKDSLIRFTNGNLAIEGHIYLQRSDLAVISADGDLLKIRIPNPEKAPPRIEIRSDLPTPAAPPAAQAKPVVPAKPGRQ
jgi:hypothetical protein